MHKYFLCFERILDVDKETLYKNENFKKLCDIVAKNNLVCLTGAGISSGLKVKKYEKAPDWKDLLRNIQIRIEEEIGLFDNEKDDLTELLSEEAVGDQLIEAASILYSKNKDIFYEALVDSVDLDKGETSSTHKYILDLSPREIVTFNYDTGHENAMKECDVFDNWDVILPKDNDAIINTLKNNMSSPFLFKAHGTVNEPETMVLTGTSYRSLFNQYPYYKAFMQHIFTNFNLLIIGFGLSDFDFDILLQNVFSIFGSPIQEHIVIKHIKDKSPKDTLFKLRYGLNFIYVDDFSDIPTILKESTTHPGHSLEKIMRDCISNYELRGKSHKEVRKLSDIGKKCLATMLEGKIKANIALEKIDGYSLNTETSEYVYTYGVIASSTKNKEYKEFLINEVVNKSNFSEPIAHALVHLRDVLEREEIRIVEKWLKDFKEKGFTPDTENPDPDNRVYTYCEAIYYLLKAKERS